MLPIDISSELHRLIANISAETALLHAGSDEGMIPLYSLTSELIPIADGDDSFKLEVEQLAEAVGDLLDQGGIATDELIVSLCHFVEKLHIFGSYYDKGEAHAWESIEIELKQSIDETADKNNASDVVNEEVSDKTPESQVQSAAASAINLDEIAQESDVLLELDLEGSRDVLEEFYQEADEHLESIESALLDLEQDPEDPDAIRSMFRSFHTIKGVAGFLDMTPIRILAHEIETLMDLMRSGEIELCVDLTSLIFESRDRLVILLQQVYDGLNGGKQPDKIIAVSDLIYKAKLAILGVQQAEVAADRDDGTTEVKSAVAGSPETVPSVVNQAPINSDPSDDPVPLVKQKKVASTLRMDTDKLDSVIEAVGELVIVESQLRESLATVVHTSASRIETNLRQLSRITRDLQNSSLSLRMVSVKPLFQRMQRLARDVAAKSGKVINFRVEGEDTEMDRTVVEQISDPLVHMIRNSVDHGIEAPDKRVEAGKHHAGEILLKASYIGDSIVLELKDDGAGICSEAVTQKAIERGLAQEGVSYTREEVINFIFQPGFSTAAKVSDFSGRGVGLDVVRSNVQQLRGRIDLDSVEGEGSTTRISLPLTMAIIDGLLIRSSGERYVIPVSSINMTLKPIKSQLHNVQNRGQVIKHRDQLFSLMHLDDFFEIEGERADTLDSIVVMIETDLCDYGLVVDEILHKQEVVIKQLGGNSNTEGVSGGAILGDGTVALILDPAIMADRVKPASVA
ncbi:MAG: chemotaxis protein CheA [Opitutales bacterium]